VTVRGPGPGERGVVADLVLQSDCGMLPTLFGGSVRALLEHLHFETANPYSSMNTLVIIRDSPGAPVIGAMVGSLVGSARRSNLHTAWLLARWYGPAVIARLPLLARAGKVLEGMRSDDFYVSHIAVTPDSQRRGVGRELLLSGEKRARENGAGRMVLDVEEHNETARAFYARQGYRQLSPVRVDLGRIAFSFHRLFKGL
jgi:ribosomal protein S18 acetylase RimI-like enzyme